MTYRLIYVRDITIKRVPAGFVTFKLGPQNLN
jgi:hypothetical protein